MILTAFPWLSLLENVAEIIEDMGHRVALATEPGQLLAHGRRREPLLLGPELAGGSAVPALRAACRLGPTRRLAVLASDRHDRLAEVASREVGVRVFHLPLSFPTVERDLRTWLRDWERCRDRVPPPDESRARCAFGNVPI